MSQSDEQSRSDYPLGRGYGHDYMRGGEVLGGYGYADREDYAKPRGELLSPHAELGGAESLPLDGDSGESGRDG